LPSDSKTTREPSGETSTPRSILVRKLCGATSTGWRSAAATLRVEWTWNGIVSMKPESTSTRWICPCAQTTTERPSGVQAIAG